MPYQLPSSDEINAVDLSWRRYLLPAIHPEGVKILAVEAVIVVLVGLLGLLWAPLYSLYSLGLAVLVFSFYFFRNPTRVPPVGDRLVLAPADGIVSNIVEMVPPPELGCGDQPLIRVSIFMSVFSVHVNRAPVGGTVTALKYVPGKFVSVQDKDSEDNERQLIAMRTPYGETVGFVQIAGLVARRIYCPLKLKDQLKAGDVFGMIRFGSRLDVFLPKGVTPKVRPGQVAVAGESILAELPPVDRERRVLTVGGVAPGREGM